MGSLNPFAGNSSGAGFHATGTDEAQLNTAYNQTQAGIKAQQDFVNALNANNGLANQANVFGQQQGLANQLQGVANGTGPNAALAQLNQTTGQNVANQAAMMAGQRGAGQNVGLMSRQAANQGANIQQQAAGQGATMQAQQQLAAMQQLGQQQANMGNMANTQIGQRQAGITELNQAAQGQQANLMGMQQNMNTANANIAAGNQAAQGNMLGNLMGGVGSAVTMAGGAGMLGSGLQTYLNNKATGGKKGGAEGGEVDSMPDLQSKMQTLGQPNISGPISKIGQHFKTHMMAEGGKVPALVSPGEQYLPPKDVKEVAKGANPLEKGERIPGKPKYKGNNYANDTVPKTLESGGIVIPNEVMQSKNPAHEAKKFVAAILAKQGKIAKSRNK